MKNKIISSIFILSLLFIGNINAQNTLQATKAVAHKECSKEENQCSSNQAILQLKKTYIQENFELSSSEKTKFWTAYDQYINDECQIHEAFKNDLSKQGINIKSNSKEAAQLTDEQTLYKIERRFLMKEQLLNLDKKFFQTLKTILTSDKMVSFYKIEREFKHKCTSEKSKSPNSESPKTLTPTKNK